MTEMSYSKYFWSMKINHSQMDIFSSTYSKLTIYDGNMFQSNESSGIMIPRIKRLI